MRYLIALLITIIASPVFAEGSVGAPTQQQAAVKWYGGNQPPAYSAMKTAPAEVCAEITSNPPLTLGTCNGSNCSKTSYGCFSQFGLISVVNGGCPAGYATTGTNGSQNPPTGCLSSTAQCPTGSTLTSGQCVCNTGLSPHNGQCITPQCTTKGEASSGYYDMGSTVPPPDPPTVACIGGCLAVYSGNSVGFSRLKNGVRGYYAKGAYDFLGGGNSDICTGSTAPSSSAALPTDTCPAGQVKFTVNGNAGCVTSTGETTTPPPTKTTTTTNTSNPNGSTTQTTTTTDTGTGQTTSSSVTYPPGTTPPPTGTKVEPSTSGSGSGNDDGKGSCGGSGQPPCKIDETGTPTDGDLSEQHTAYDQASQAREESITAIGNAQQVTELPWVWSPSFPTGSCQNLDFDIGGGKGAVIDVCSSSHLQTARQLWGWLLYMLFAVYAWKRFTGSVERD